MNIIKNLKCFALKCTTWLTAHGRDTPKQLLAPLNS